MLHANDAVKNKNLLALQKLVEQNGDYLATDQIEELYAKLLRKVQDAATADWRVDSRTKKIKRGDLSLWFRRAVGQFLAPARLGGGKSARSKMKAAGLPEDAIETALESRRFYRREVLSQKYLPLTDQRLIEGEVAATLQRLRSELDTGSIPDSGVEFHAICLRHLDELRTRLAVKSGPPLAFLQGCMYDITDRCLHRFRRVTA